MSKILQWGLQPVFSLLKLQPSRIIVKSRFCQNKWLLKRFKSILPKYRNLLQVSPPSPWIELIPSTTSIAPKIQEILKNTNTNMKFRLLLDSPNLQGFKHNIQIEAAIKKCLILILKQSKRKDMFLVKAQWGPLLIKRSKR